MGVDQRSVLEVKLEQLVACIARDRLLQYVAAQEDRLLLLRVPLLRVRLFALTVERVVKHQAVRIQHRFHVLARRAHLLLLAKEPGRHPDAR